MSDDHPERLDAETLAALTPDSVRNATRARLMARAANAVSAPTGSPSHMEVHRIPARVFSYRAVMAGLALAASLVLAFVWRSQRDRLRETMAASESARALLADSLSAVVARNAALLEALTGPEVRVVTLGGVNQTSPSARMFWDQATNRWTFFAHHFPKLPSGRTYQLWLVTAGRPISAGTFSVDTTGSAVVQATYPLDRTALRAVAVTEEPSGGVAAPTSTPVVLGSGS